MSSKVKCTCGWSWNKSDSSKKDMYICHQCGKDNTMKDGGWLNKFDAPEAENGIEGTMGGLTDQGFNYNGAWGGTMAMGGSLPGAVGFTYARTQGSAPANGKYTKKTKASAQNGEEMKFYQEGLDWKPKNISRNGIGINKFQDGGTKSKAVDFFTDALDVASYLSPVTAIPKLVGKGVKQLGKVALSRAAENLNPFDYGEEGNTLVDRVKNTILLNEKEGWRENVDERLKKGRQNISDEEAVRLDLLQMYAGKPQLTNSIIQSQYRPSVSKNKQDKYYSSPAIERSIIENLYNPTQLNLFKGVNVKSKQDIDNLIKTQLLLEGEDERKSVGKVAKVPGLGFATLSAGEDESGPYLSYYDKWDINPFSGQYSSSDNSILNKIGKKYLSSGDIAEGLSNVPEIYGRIYFDKKTGKPRKMQEGGVIEDPNGQWSHPGEITRIPSNQITMQGVDYPVLGISDTGDMQMMYPNQDYTYDGESVTEYPMMQVGGKVSLRSLMNNDDLKAKSDATKVVPQKTMTKEQAAKFKARKDAEELQRRKSAIAKSVEAKSKTFSVQNLADESGAIGDKFRIFPNDPDSFIDEYINPGVMIGNMASGIGRIPLNIQEGNYGQAAMSVATPLAVGALAGIGAQSTGQFANNLVNPFAGTGEFLTTQTPLKNVYKINPWAFKPNPEAYYRGIGKSGFDQAIETGVIGGRPNSTFGEDVYMSSMLDVAKQYSKDFKNPFNKNFGVKGVGNKTGYIAEIPRTSLTNPNSPTPYETWPGTFFHEFKNPKAIPLDDVKLLKEDWLRGYKQINVPANSVTPQPNTANTWQLQELPGLHLKSTMEGEAISRIVEPKTGLINTEQALAIIGKESGGADKVALIRQGLGDNIPKKMDFNDFRKTVQDQLIPLEKQFSTQRSDYGIDRLGYNEGNFTTSTVGDRIVHNLESDLIENETLILGNKNKFGRGSDAHGNPEETLGHAHFLRDVETPDVLTVTQIQSDAFQGTNRTMPRNIEDATQKLNETKSDSEYVLKLMGNEKEKFKGVFDNANKHLQLDQATVDNFAQKSLLDKNHQERYLQELVDYAGKRGDVNKVRVPTSDTAAKVQGYTPIQESTLGAVTKKQLDESSTFEEFFALKKEEIGDYELNSEELNTFKKIYTNYKTGNLGKIYDPSHTTILKKYSEQPKTIKKLFGKEPTIVTDSKGNTWYEFDIPKKFKEGKGEIKAFGLSPFALPTALGLGAASQIEQKKNGGWLNKYN
jgi:hypothetical protein